MSDIYEEDDYDDDDYHDYDHPSLNPNQYYFKFDVTPDSPISSWIMDIIKDMGGSDKLIPFVHGFPVKKFPVNSWNPNTGGTKKPQYLGSNYYGEPVWKTKYFLYDPVDIIYRNHTQSNAVYFLQQPSYYKGLFDILN